MNIPIVYEDDWLLVADKPCGLLTIPTPKHEKRTLTSILNEDLKVKALTYRLHPCHRLDRETSGLIIYAKGKSAQKKMMQLFKGRNIKKTYLAFVQGKLKPKGKINKNIEGMPALTIYERKDLKNGFSVVRAHPVTGRTNQLRIHFKAIGHPILGETKYAFRRDFSVKAKRLCLHAQRLEFTHPFTKKQMRLEAELPQDLKEFLKTHV